MTDATQDRAAEPCIHILVVPEHEVCREPAGLKWCFRCRRRLEHEDVLYTPDDRMSYYGPRWALECPRCHQDHTRFPDGW